MSNQITNDLDTYHVADRILNQAFHGSSFDMEHGCDYDPELGSLDEKQSKDLINLCKAHARAILGPDAKEAIAEVMVLIQTDLSKNLINPKFWELNN